MHNISGYQNNFLLILKYFKNIQEQVLFVSQVKKNAVLSNKET